MIVRLIFLGCNLSNPLTGFRPFALAAAALTSHYWYSGAFWFSDWRSSRSQDSSRGYNCWMARSIVPFPVFTIQVAARVTLGLPVIRRVTTPSFQRFCGWFSSSTMTTSPILGCDECFCPF